MPLGFEKEVHRSFADEGAVVILRRSLATERTRFTDLAMKLQGS